MFWAFYIILFYGERLEHSFLLAVVKYSVSSRLLLLWVWWMDWLRARSCNTVAIDWLIVCYHDWLPGLNIIFLQRTASFLLSSTFYTETIRFYSSFVWSVFLWPYKADFCVRYYSLPFCYCFDRTPSGSESDRRFAGMPRRLIFISWLANQLIGSSPGKRMKAKMMHDRKCDVYVFEMRRYLRIERLVVILRLFLEIEKNIKTA